MKTIVHVGAALVALLTLASVAYAEEPNKADLTKTVDSALESIDMQSRAMEAAQANIPNVEASIRRNARLLAPGEAAQLLGQLANSRKNAIEARQLFGRAKTHYQKAQSLLDTAIDSKDGLSQAREEIDAGARDFDQADEFAAEATGIVFSVAKTIENLPRRLPGGSSGR
jgi:hypothetical protein